MDIKHKHIEYEDTMSADYIIIMDIILLIALTDRWTDLLLIGSLYPQFPDLIFIRIKHL